MSLIEEFEIRIPSESSAAHEVQERITSTLEKLAFPHRDVFGMRLALEEALINAIKHGNRLDPTKTVWVECRIWQDELHVVIEDEGPGFRPEDVPDPTDEENLEKPGGRGLMLMRSFVDEIEFNSCGNRIKMVKRRGAESESA